MSDEWDQQLEQMFADLTGEMEVARRDDSGKPIAWRLTDARKAELLREQKKLH